MVTHLSAHDESAPHCATQFASATQVGSSSHSAARSQHIV